MVGEEGVVGEVCFLLFFLVSNFQQDGVVMEDGAEPVLTDDQMLDMEIESDLKNLALNNEDNLE